MTSGDLCLIYLIYNIYRIYSIYHNYIIDNDMIYHHHYLSRRARRRAALVAVSALLTFASCEKAITDEQAGKTASVTADAANVVLRMTTPEDNSRWDGTSRAANASPASAAHAAGATRAAVPIVQIATRLSVVVFAADGSKVQTIVQMLDKQTDDFGNVGLQLAAGDYRVVCIAHSGEGNCTVSSEDKVTFHNNKVTDTFAYCGTLSIADAADRQTIDITLHRRVARFRLMLTDDELPARLSQMKLYYLGGSSTFSPALGCGIVQSKQTELRQVGQDGPRVLDIYTFPHEEDDRLTRLTVTALDADGQTLKERVFENVPVAVNETTQYEGRFFGAGGTTGGDGLTLTADGEWGATHRYSY